MAKRTLTTVHPTGRTVDIVGLLAGDRDRHCEEHRVCGVVVKEDVVVRFRKVQIINQHGDEETAIAVYWVTDGIDRCRVGFLPKHHIREADELDGALGQVQEVFSAYDESKTRRNRFHRNMGLAVAAIITDTTKLDDSKKEACKKKQKEENESTEQEQNSTNNKTIN